MSILETIRGYKTFNDEEAVYKKSFIQFLTHFSQEERGIRDNLIGHLTPTAWIVNPDKTKVLMAFHKIYQSWGWLGGHADGDLDCLRVAQKEVQEESGLKEFKVFSDTPFDLSVIQVFPHVRKGVFVPAHIHFNPVYLFEASEESNLEHQPDENEGVEWISNEKVIESISEPHLVSTYLRLMDKVKKL